MQITINCVNGRPTTWEHEDGIPNERELFVCIVSIEKKRRGIGPLPPLVLSTVLTDAENKDQAITAVLSLTLQKYPSSQYNVQVFAQGYRVNKVRQMIDDIATVKDDSILDSDELG